MAGLVSLLISARQQRAIALALSLLIFVVLAALAACVVADRVNSVVEMQNDAMFAEFEHAEINVGTTLAALKSEVTASPCSPEFQSQLRRVAFLPDGFSEFLYAPGGQVQCFSGSLRFDAPISLGKPDIVSATAVVWLDRGLEFLGLRGFVGSIVAADGFAIVVPPRAIQTRLPSWMQAEIILMAPGGGWWHRAGDVEVYDRYMIAKGPRGPLIEPVFRSFVCDPRGAFCIAGEADLVSFFQANRAMIGFGLAIIAAVSIVLSSCTKAFIVRHWSFEARFRRHLDADSVICVYQPIMDLHSGRIVGCEVLARWRDVDDSIVYPDRFIPLVERYGLTMKFTQFVADRAFADLTDAVPPGEHLKLTFNIFPRDFDAAFLTRVFARFAEVRERFSVVIELVETDAIVVETAQRQIETLRETGIKTYIDDFGVGYSNIQNLAGLAVDGVKLDRAFAMAPEGSLMFRMLTLTIEMIHASGRLMVVEGVETEERLQHLRGVQPPIDCVQGYHISRPLDAGAFARFLTARRPFGSVYGIAA